MCVRPENRIWRVAKRAQGIPFMQLPCERCQALVVRTDQHEPAGHTASQTIDHPYLTRYRKDHDAGSLRYMRSCLGRNLSVDFEQTRACSGSWVLR
jgi:hypothetical protein